MRRGHKGGLYRGQSKTQRPRKEFLPQPPPISDIEPIVDIEIISDGRGNIVGYAANTKSGAETLIHAKVERIFDRTNTSFPED